MKGVVNVNGCISQVSSTTCFGLLLTDTSSLVSWIVGQTIFLVDEKRVLSDRNNPGILPLSRSVTASLATAPVFHKLLQTPLSSI